jgi:hypothetical protein
MMAHLYFLKVSISSQSDGADLRRQREGILLNDNSTRIIVVLMKLFYSNSLEMICPGGF